MVLTSASQASGVGNWADRALFSEKSNTGREAGLRAGVGEGAAHEPTLGHAAFGMLFRSSGEDVKEDVDT